LNAREGRHYRVRLEAFPPSRVIGALLAPAGVVDTGLPAAMAPEVPPAGGALVG
jgi:hypothetical protein